MFSTTKINLEMLGNNEEISHISDHNHNLHTQITKLNIVNKSLQNKLEKLTNKETSSNK